MAAKTQRTLRSEKLPRSRWMPVAKLRPRRNARLHTPDQIQLIADSIVEYGWTNPLIVDEKGSILAGHGRWEAAKGLGLKRVPAIPKEGLTAAQKRAYVIPLAGNLRKGRLPRKRQCSRCGSERTKQRRDRTEKRVAELSDEALRGALEHPASLDTGTTSPIRGVE